MNAGNASADANCVTQIQNDLFDAMLRARLTPKQWRVMVDAIRETDNFTKPALDRADTSERRGGQ